MAFNCLDLIVHNFLTGISICTGETQVGTTCAAPSCGYSGLAAREAGEEGLALLRQQLRQAVAEPQASC